MRVRCSVVIVEVAMEHVIAVASKGSLEWNMLVKEMVESVEIVWRFSFVSGYLGEDLQA